jgi:multidrug resistance efflux pump
MDSLPPIPTPATQRLREFRIQFVPPVFFLLVIAAIFYIWKNYVQPLHVVGEVEAIHANLMSIQDGTLSELMVDRLDRVSKDQPLARIVTVDPAAHEAALNVIAADLKLMQARMNLDKVRNVDSYTRLRLDLMTEKIALGIAQARVKQAESELQRLKKLYEQKLIPQGVAQGSGQNNIFGVDVAQRDHEALLVEIDHRTRLIAQLEKEIKAMEAAGAAEVASRDPAVEETIRAQQEQLALIEKPVNLKAPFDGTVSIVYKRSGEKVIRGEPILTLAPATATRIIGYIRQPLSVLPTTNDVVEVQSRSQHRQLASARIIKVGSQLELINPALLSLDSNRVEFGLPILVALPENMKLLPGEFVDLAIRVSGK